MFVHIHIYTFYIQLCIVHYYTFCTIAAGLCKKRNCWQKKRRKCNCTRRARIEEREIYCLIQRNYIIVSLVQYACTGFISHFSPFLFSKRFQKNFFNFLLYLFSSVRSLSAFRSTEHLFPFPEFPVYFPNSPFPCLKFGWLTAPPRPQRPLIISHFCLNKT